MGSGHSVGPVLVAGAEIDPDAVLGEDIGGDGADVGEPPSDRSSFRLPQPLGALVDVTLEAFGVPTAGRRRAECGRQRTGGLPVGSLVVVPGSIREELEGVAHGAALAGENEVDGRAAVAAAVATPALVALVAAEDAERRGAAGLDVVRVGAGPHRAAGASGVAADEVIGKRGEIGGGEEGFAVVHVTPPRPRRRASHSSGHRCRRSRLRSGRGRGGQRPFGHRASTGHGLG